MVLIGILLYQLVVEKGVLLGCDGISCMCEGMLGKLTQPKGIVTVCMLTKVSVHFESSTVQESIGFAYPESSGID